LTVYQHDSDHLPVSADCTVTDRCQQDIRHQPPSTTTPYSHDCV